MSVFKADLFITKVEERIARESKKPFTIANVLDSDSGQTFTIFINSNDLINVLPKVEVMAENECICSFNGRNMSLKEIL